MAWRIACAAIALIAVAVRYYHLGLVPFHNDEGVNGYFLLVLFRSGFYHYDPANYHGSTLYYLTLIPSFFNRIIFGGEGLSTIAARSLPAFFGTATVLTVFQLRRYLGTVGAVAAGALLALSPAAVYFSRYFIHETLFVYFTLALVVASVRYRETMDSDFLMLASVSAAFLFATKETAIISVAVLILAHFCTRTYAAVFWHETNGSNAGGARKPGSGISRKQVLGRQTPCSTSSGSRWPRVPIAWIAAVAIFVFIYVTFYGSFGSNFPRGVFDSVRTFRYWVKAGAENNVHDWLTYVHWLLQEELPTLLLGVVGLELALYQKSNRFALFCGFWTLGMLAAYSLLPYKTPWLILNITLPLTLLAGYGASECIAKIMQHGRRLARVCIALSFGIVLTFSAYQTLVLNFVKYDDDAEPYVYAHTSRQFLPLLDKVNNIAQINGSGKQIKVAITSPDYWPLPWYLRDYPNVGYWGHIVSTQDAIVIGDTSQESELYKLLGNNYVRVDSYDLRPGVVLVLFARRDMTL
jgi:uncharacterized protein (TIGR03663 family)